MWFVVHGGLCARGEGFFFLLGSGGELLIYVTMTTDRTSVLRLTHGFVLDPLRYDGEKKKKKERKQ
jgi:hypothetical protein